MINITVVKIYKTVLKYTFACEQINKYTRYTAGKILLISFSTHDIMLTMNKDG